MAITADLTIKPLGDTWRSPRWALVTEDAVIDLTEEAWTVRAQARYPGQVPILLHEWTVANGGIEFGTASFTVDGEQVEGTTVRLRMPAPAVQTASDEWAGVWDLEVSHPTYDDGSLWRKTMVSGYARTVSDVTR